MNELTKALSLADEDFLISLANKGIYKRAGKDIEGISPEITDNGNSAEVKIGGETVTVKVPLTDCKCTCVSRTVCRHIIGALLIMKNTILSDIPSEPQTQTESEEKHHEPDTIPEKPAALSENNESADKDSSTYQYRNIIDTRPYHV